MKRSASILMILLLIISLCSCGSSQDQSDGSDDYEEYEDSGFLPVGSLPDDYIYWDEAYQHIGEVTTVVGPIVSVPVGSASYINIGNDYSGGISPDSIFMARFWYNDKGYNEETLQPYVGRTVMVYGEIQDWDGGIPMIDISLPESQLTCLEDDEYFEDDFLDDEAGMFDNEEYEDEYYEDSGFLPEESLPEDYIYWDEAYQHIGEVTTVVGPIVSVPVGSASYINIGNDYSGGISPDSIFMARFWYNDKGYNEETLQPYVGRTVMVYGEIQDWDGGIPMIDISLPESRLICLKDDYY